MRGTISRPRLILAFGILSLVAMAGMAVVNRIEEIRTVLFSIEWRTAAPSDVWYIDSTGRHDVPITRIAPTAKQFYSGGQWVTGDAYKKGVRYELHATAPNGSSTIIAIYAGVHVVQDHANPNHRQLFAILEAVW